MGRDAAMLLVGEGEARSLCVLVLEVPLQMVVEEKEVAV